MSPPNSTYALPVRKTAAKKSPLIGRKDFSAAALKSTSNVDMAPETMKKKKEAGTGTSTSFPNVSQSRSLSTVGTVKTEYMSWLSIPYTSQVERTTGMGAAIYLTKTINKCVEELR